MPVNVSQELLDHNQRLLNAIVTGDWKTYEALCDSSITCFEPEARGQLAVGMAFHKFYFDLPSAPQKPAKTVTMSQPHVRLMGDSAVLMRLGCGSEAGGTENRQADEGGAEVHGGGRSGKWTYGTCVPLIRQPSC